MMKFILIVLALFLIFIVVSGCVKTGYAKSSGQWTWATNDVQHSQWHHPRDGLDNDSFKVLRSLPQSYPTFLNSTPSANG